MHHKRKTYTCILNLCFFSTIRVADKDEEAFVKKVSYNKWRYFNSTNSSMWILKNIVVSKHAFKHTISNQK